MAGFRSTVSFLLGASAAQMAGCVGGVPVSEKPETVLLDAQSSIPPDLEVLKGITTRCEANKIAIDHCLFDERALIQISEMVRRGLSFLSQGRTPPHWKGTVLKREGEQNFLYTLPDGQPLMVDFHLGDHGPGKLNQMVVEPKDQHTQGKNKPTVIFNNQGRVQLIHTVIPDGDHADSQWFTIHVDPTSEQPYFECPGMQEAICGKEGRLITEEGERIGLYGDEWKKRHFTTHDYLRLLSTHATSPTTWLGISELFRMKGKKEEEEADFKKKGNNGLQRYGHYVSPDIAAGRHFPWQSQTIAFVVKQILSERGLKSQVIDTVAQYFVEPYGPNTYPYQGAATIWVTYAPGNKMYHVNYFTLRGGLGRDGFFYSTNSTGYLGSQGFSAPDGVDVCIRAFNVSGRSEFAAQTAYAFAYPSWDNKIPVLKPTANEMKVDMVPFDSILNP